jgi:hypothetical protein
MHNGDDDPGELYYSNGGELNLITNKVSPKGGLSQARISYENAAQPFT